MSGTRLRWAASAALAVVAAVLAFSLLRDASADPSRAASGATGDATGTDASSAADTATPASPTAGQASDPPTAPSSATAAPSSDASTTASADSSADPSTDPSAGASSGPEDGTVDPDAGPPLRSDATLGLTVGAAEALARFYVGEAVNYLKLTGDGTAVRTVTAEACRPCRDEIGLFAGINGRNERLSGDYLWKNLEVRSVRSTGARTTVVDLKATRGRHTALENSGPHRKLYPGGPVTLELTLVAEGNNWIVFDLGLA